MWQIVSPTTAAIRAAAGARGGLRNLGLLLCRVDIPGGTCVGSCGGTGLALVVQGACRYYLGKIANRQRWWRPAVRVSLKVGTDAKATSCSQFAPGETWRVVGAVIGRLAVFTDRPTLSGMPS